MKSCHAGQPCNMCHISVHQVCNPHHIISYDIIWHHIGEHFAAIQHWTRRSSYCRRVGAVQGNGRRRGRIGASWVQGPSWFNVQRAVNAALQCSGMFHDIILCHMTSPAVSIQPFWTKHPFFDPTICCPPDRMHQADQGVFKSILSWSVSLLEDMAFGKGGGTLQNAKVDELNRYVISCDLTWRHVMSCDICIMRVSQEIQNPGSFHRHENFYDRYLAFEWSECLWISRHHEVCSCVLQR
jgi:hypothetical protein